MSSPEEKLLKETQRNQIRKNFELFRDEYSDDIPEGEELRNYRRSPDKYFYKCSPGFFIRVRDGVNRIISWNITSDQEVISRCREFLNFFEGINKSKFEKGELADEADVARIKDFVGYIITKLSK